jgi:hypothetical protein
VAPGDGAAEGPLALRERPAPRGQDGEALPQPGQDLLWRQDLRPGGRQLDGQGQAVQPGGDLRHRRRVPVGEREAGPHRLGPLGEQPDRFDPAEGAEVREPFGIGQLQRRHHVLLLAPQRQRDAGGDHRLQRRGRGEELLERRARRRHLFEVVDHQQQLLVAEVVLHGLEDGAPGHLRDPHGPRHRRGNQGGIGHRRQVHEDHAVLELGEQLRGDLEGQPGLAGAPGAGEGEQAGPAEEPPDLGDLLLPAHERGELHGEVVPPGVQRPGRRELGREPVDHQVVQVHRQGDVLQPVLPEVPERRSLRQGVLHQHPGGVGDDHLPAVGRRGDPGARFTSMPT